MNIHENIVTMRKRNTKSQAEMAEALGISRVSYGKIERGESSVTFDRIQELCEIFECTINDLINVSTVEITHVYPNTDNRINHNNLIQMTKLQHQYIEVFEHLYQIHKEQFSVNVLAELKIQIETFIDSSHYSVANGFVEDLIGYIQQVHDAKEYAKQL